MTKLLYFVQVTGAKKMYVSVYIAGWSWLVKYHNLDIQIQAEYKLLLDAHNFGKLLIKFDQLFVRISEGDLIVSKW